MLKEKWLVAICAGWQQEHSIKTAKTSGFKVIAFDGDSNAPGKQYADLFFTIDVNNPGLIIKKINELSLDIACAVSFISDIGMVTAGEINDFFETGGMSAVIAKNFTNKKIQRKVFDRLGFSNSQWMSVKPDDDFSKASLDTFLSRDVIVKPISSAGSKGITKLEYPYTNLFSALLDGFKYSSELIIETFITGTEYSVETFWTDGSCEILAISERIIEKDKTASIIKSVVLEKKTEAAVIDAVEKVNIELGIRSGPAHTELIIDSENGIYILETAARGGGFGVFDKLVPKITRIDHTFEHIQVLMGLKIQARDKEKYRQAALYFLPSKTGVIQSVVGFESLGNIEGVSGASFVKVGDLTCESEVDSDRTGYILIDGPDGTDFQKKLSEAMAVINITYK